MKKNYPQLSSYFKPGFFLVVFLLFSLFSFAQNNLNVNNSYTINGFERYDNVSLPSNNSVLTVNGTLVVDGDFIMGGNKSQFKMGSNARVIIFGDLDASNQVELSVSSYLIIHGNFIKGGSSNQGELNVDDGNIYIYGEVDNWGSDFTTCGDYLGNTNEINEKECEYGTEDDFINNPDIPDDILELSNCYDLKVNDQNIFLGSNAIFTASEANLQNVESFQWQTKNNEGNWVNLPGENQFEFQINNPELEDSGKQYRVIVQGSNDNCKISISNSAVLRVVKPIEIVDQPKNVIICQNNEVNFNVKAEGKIISYQWQRNDGGNSENFFDISNNTYFQNTQTANLIVNASETWLDSKRFRVKITAENGYTLTSNSALLTVNKAPQGIYTQPKNEVVCEGNDISFQTYTSNNQRQWQVSEDNGNTWSYISNSEYYQNVNGERLDIVKTPVNFDQNLYRLEVSNQNCSVYSNPASLSVYNNPIITRQPQDITTPFGENAIFETKVSGNNITYQWQTYSSNWYDINDSENYSGTKTEKLELITVGYWPEDGSRYRLLATNENGCISISEVAVLNVGQNLCETENTWTGTENTNWNNTNNWSCNSLPTLETNVLIPENLASGNYPKISAGTNALSKDLTIENNASVEVTDNWLRISGNLTNNGILNTETGSVSFEGTSAQIIPNSAFENNRIQNLQIDNPLGVTSQAIIEITGTLKVEDGNLDTGNELTLISNENQTAFIDGSGNGEVIGLVSMQRYLDKAFGYKYFSSPFQNSVVGDFAPFMDFSDPESGFPHFYRYEENRRVDSLDLDATGWEDYIEPTNTLNISEGYALNFGTSSAPQTIELIGEVNNGPISSGQLENNHREYTKGFHLVGNPYPSPIDWNAANGWTRDNIDDGIYFFTASDDNQYTGTYTAFVNDISTGDSNVDGSSENIIPSMQGFFIKVSDSDIQDLVTGSFGMDNNVRITNFEQEFYRSQLPEQKSLLRLEAGFKGANRKDAMVIYFSTYATPNFEKEMDAHKLMNTDPAVPSFYNITTDKKELAINAIPFPESRSYKKIPIGIKADQDGPMHINLASIENLSSNFNVYLIDHTKSIGQNLNKDPEYTFNIKAGTHNSRFELMFSEEEVPSPAIAFNEPFDVKVENGNVVIELNLEESQQGILRASTITGQILQIKEGRGKDRVIFEGITSNGVYIINLQVGKERHAKKVVIKK